MLKGTSLLSLFLALVFLLTGCITMNPPPASTPAPIPPPTLPPPAVTPTPTPTRQPIDIGAFIATPDWQPSWTEAQMANTKASIDKHFGLTYYTKRTFYLNRYEPYDLTKLNKALSDLGRLPWSYEANYFDCSEMSALVELYLEMSHFDSVMVRGRNPKVQGVGHAWVVTFVQERSGTKAVPVEATALCIPKSTGNLFGKPPNQTMMNYNDYLDNGWTLRDIYEAETVAPGEFDWWNSYPVSISELFGEPVPAEMGARHDIIPQISVVRGAAIRPWFGWNAVDWAIGYELQVADNAAFSIPIISKTGANALTTTDYMCEIQLDYSTAYYWRVRGVAKNAHSEWGIGMFTTKAPPPPMKR